MTPKTHFLISKMMLTAITALALIGCSPMDKKLHTSGTLEVYQASLQPLYAEMTKHETEAFDWAVSDFDLPKLNTKYPDATPREIVRGEVKAVLDTYPARIKSLQEDAAKTRLILDEIAKVHVTQANFYISKDFFGLQPKIKAVIVNGSSLPISQMQWKASLFVDGGATAVATTTLNDDYRRNDGMTPGSAWTTTFTVGFVKGDQTWTTLQIRNAKETRVDMEPIASSVLDFADRPYAPTDFDSQIKSLSAAVEAAKSFHDI